MYVSPDEFEEILRHDVDPDGQHWTDPVSGLRFQIRSQAYEQFLQDLRIIDEDVCERWYNNKTVDPITNEPLDENEYKYERLRQICKPKKKSLFKSVSNALFGTHEYKHPQRRRPGADERRRIKLKQKERQKAEEYQQLSNQELIRLKLDYQIRRSYFDLVTLSIVRRRTDEIQSFLDRKYTDITACNDRRAQNIIAMIHRPTRRSIRSTTATYWIALGAESDYYGFPLQTLISRWLREVNGPLTAIHLRAKTIQDPDEQSMYFGLGVLYYLMFGLYDDAEMKRMTQQDWNKHYNRCPYTHDAFNFILTLAETDQCQCQSYTNYVIAAAEEFDYNNIHECKIPGHIYPIITRSSNGATLIGIEAGYEHNANLIIYYEGNPHHLDWLIQDLHYVTITLFPDQVCEKYVLSEEVMASNLVDKLNNLLVKTVRSSDKILLESLITLHTYGWGDLVSLFKETIKNFMISFETFPLPAKRTLAKTDYRLDAKWIQHIESFKAILPQKAFVSLWHFPFSVSTRMIQYKQSVPIRLEPRTDIGAFITMTAIPYYRRTFFIFNESLDKKSSKLGYTKVITEESKNDVGPKQVYMFKTSAEEMPYSELTRDVKRSIINEVNSLIRLINPNDFDNVFYPADKDGVYSVYPDPPLPKEINSFITNQLKAKFQ